MLKISYLVVAFYIGFMIPVDSSKNNFICRNKCPFEQNINRDILKNLNILIKLRVLVDLE